MFLNVKRIFVCLCLCCLLGVNSSFAVKFLVNGNFIYMCGEGAQKMTVTVLPDPTLQVSAQLFYSECTNLNISRFCNSAALGSVSVTKSFMFPLVKAVHD